MTIPLQSKLTETDPAGLSESYLQLARVKPAFMGLKGDLAVRPIYHHFSARIEAHIFVVFLA